jgi:hypothetical protein
MPRKNRPSTDESILPTQKPDPKNPTQRGLSQSAPTTPKKASRFVADSPTATTNSREILSLVDSEDSEESDEGSVEDIDDDSSAPLSFHFFGKRVAPSENPSQIDLGRSIPRNYSKTQQTCARVILQNLVMLNKEISGVDWLKSLFNFLNAHLTHEQKEMAQSGKDENEVDIVGNKVLPSVFILQPEFLYDKKEDHEEALENDYKDLVELFNTYAARLFPRPVLVIFLTYGFVTPFDSQRSVPVGWVKLFSQDYDIRQTSTKNSDYTHVVLQIMILNGREGIFFLFHLNLDLDQDYNILCRSLNKKLDIPEFRKPTTLPVCLLKNYYKTYSKKAYWVDARNHTLPTDLWWNMFQVFATNDLQVDVMVDLSPNSLLSTFEACTRFWNFSKHSESSGFIRSISLVSAASELRDELLSSYVNSESLTTLIKRNYEGIYEHLESSSWMNCYQMINPAMPNLDGFYSTLFSMPRLILPGCWDAVKQKAPPGRKPRTTPSTPQKDKSGGAKKRKSDSHANEDKRPTKIPRVEKKNTVSSKKPTRKAKTKAKQNIEEQSQKGK